MASKSCLKNEAFSLLELVITVAIISIGVTVILEAFSYSSRVAGLSCDITEAALLAQDLMQELEFKEKQGIISTEPQEVKDKKGKFAWKYNLGLDPDFNLYRLDFAINWKRANRDERLDLNTYLR